MTHESFTGNGKKTLVNLFWYQVSKLFYYVIPTSPNTD